jgi:hypothetical protein
LNLKTIKEDYDNLYSYLKNKWYKLWEKHEDWTNVYNLEVFYKIWEEEYNCQVELFKENYNLNIKSYQKLFIWNYINLMSIEQSFAHKCCAYLERWEKTIPKSWRPKWRDLFDILHYINMSSKLDMDIIFIRLWFKTEKELFLSIYKKITIDHIWKWEDFAKEIENFSYKRINWKQMIENLLFNINKTYLNWKIKFNYNYSKELMNLEENSVLNITNSIICKKEKWFYKLFDLNIMKFIYDTKDINKIQKTIKELIIEKEFKL